MIIGGKMKEIKFTKMSGAGNDFIVIDNYNKKINLTARQIEAICRRRFSVGADGLIMIEKSFKNYDFYMRFFNNDGKEAEMCGNGGRCAARFAYLKKHARKKMEFLAKLTRPAKNTQEESGFSFTRPPVCHLRLGDWINHDIIVNSVSYDYTDSPWTFAEGQNQPMWASVTINFNIVGPAGDSGGVPLTSTDKSGYFGISSKRS